MGLAFRPVTKPTGIGQVLASEYTSRVMTAAISCIDMGPLLVRRISAL